LSEESVYKRICIRDREISVRVLKFDNGCFLAISEGSANRLGAIALAVKTLDRVETSTLIPSRFGGVLLTLIAQIAADACQGIALTSLYLFDEVGSDTAREILDEVKRLLMKQDME